MDFCPSPEDLRRVIGQGKERSTAEWAGTYHAVQGQGFLCTGAVRNNCSGEELASVVTHRVLGLTINSPESVHDYSDTHLVFTLSDLCHKYVSLSIHMET